MNKKSKKINWLFMLIIMTVSLCLASCAFSKPAKPGPNYVWVKAFKTVNGKVVPGHWKYTGPTSENGKNWVPGHLGPKGKWVEGHWR